MKSPRAVNFFIYFILRALLLLHIQLFYIFCGANNSLMCRSSFFDCSLLRLFSMHHRSKGNASLIPFLPSSFAIAAFVPQFVVTILISNNEHLSLQQICLLSFQFHKNSFDSSTRQNKRNAQTLMAIFHLVSVREFP